MSRADALRLFGFAKAADEAPPEETPWYRRASTIGLGSAAVAAPLLYALARRRNLAQDPKLRAIQEASGGRFTRILGKERPDSLWQRFKDRIAHAGGGDVIYTGGRSLPGEQQKVRGAVRHFGPRGARAYAGDVDVGLNKNMPELLGVGRDKWKEYEFFQKYAPGNMPKTESMADVIRDQLGYKNLPKGPKGREKLLREVEDHLYARYGKGFVLKDTDGVQSGGMFPNHKHDLVALRNVYRDQGLRERAKELRRAANGDAAKLNDMLAELRDAPDDAWAGRVLDKMLRDPSKVIVQKHLDQQKTTGFRAWLNKRLGYSNDREYRVHVENGRVIPELVAPRYADPLAYVFDRDQMEEVARRAQSVVDRLPPKYRRGTFGMDWMPTAQGNFKMVESNPSGRSGILGYIPWSGSVLHKHYTGQWSRPVAGAMAGVGAAGVGMAGAGAAAAYNRFMGAPAPQPQVPQPAPQPMQQPVQPQPMQPQPMQPQPVQPMQPPVQPPPAQFAPRPFAPRPFAPRPPSRLAPAGGAP